MNRTNSVCLALVILLLTAVIVPAPVRASGTAATKVASAPVPILLRLEDVSPWYALNPNRLQLLRQIAGYLGAQHVPFHVSMIPIYINPAAGEELGLWDTTDPRIQQFIDVIHYMIRCGGIIGLHGCTHQMGSGTTAADFEFSSDSHQEEGTCKYMEERVNAALDMAASAHIPITYWETPHYTASPEQYRYLESRFSILYEPGPPEYRVSQQPYLVSSSNKAIKSVCYIPTPLGMIENPMGFLSILRYAVHPAKGVFTSLFFHPFRERLHCADGTTLDLTDTSADYVEWLVKTFRQQGFTFVRVTDIRSRLLHAHSVVRP